MKHQPSELQFVDALVANGTRQFSFDEAVRRAGRSRTATANFLRRMTTHGLVDRVRRGHYVVRQLGELGTNAAAEDIALAVGAGFAGRLHRIGYRTALDEHDLVSHPSRTIQIAVVNRTHVTTLSNRPLRAVLETAAAIIVGATPLGTSSVSDLERSLLDAAARPELVGGAGVLAEAIASAESRANPKTLIDYARRLEWAPALRRVGSLSDVLEIEGLAKALEPLRPIKGDIDLEPGAAETAWRDPRWRVRWPVTREELQRVARE